MKNTTMTCAILALTGWAHLAVGEEKIEVSVTPAKPATLPGGSTKVAVDKQSVYLGRGGRTGTPQLIIGDSNLELLPDTEIAVDGSRYHFPGPFVFTFEEAREEDMILTFTGSCDLTVLASKGDQPEVQLKELNEVVTVDCRRLPQYPLVTARGEGHHFVSLKPTTADISRFHPSPELGAAVKMTVVNNFGSKSLRLIYKKQERVAIGDETIVLDSFDFNYQTKTMKIRIQTEPKAAEARATIIKYGSTPE
ncbi:MAG: hypothetical protein P8J87_07850 [Verrucomicrobiales bacterium]|nr:hypothetical protein [Verrucomicrobiales bacterium]